MDKKKIEETVYESPVIMRQQVILEQVIAAGSTRKTSDGTVTHEWNDDTEDVTIIF
jgi:hypothetical protein